MEGGGRSNGRREAGRCLLLIMTLNKKQGLGLNVYDGKRVRECVMNSNGDITAIKQSGRCQREVMWYGKMCDGLKQKKGSKWEPEMCADPMPSICRSHDGSGLERQTGDG